MGFALPHEVEFAHIFLRLRCQTHSRRDSRRSRRRQWPAHRRRQWPAHHPQCHPRTESDCELLSVSAARLLENVLLNLGLDVTVLPPAAGRPAGLGLLGLRRRFPCPCWALFADSRFSAERLRNILRCFFDLLSELLPELLPEAGGDFANFCFLIG